MLTAAKRQRILGSIFTATFKKFWWCYNPPGVNCPLYLNINYVCFYLFISLGLLSYHRHAKRKLTTLVTRFISHVHDVLVILLPAAGFWSFLRFVMLCCALFLSKSACTVWRYVAYAQVLQSNSWRSQKYEAHFTERCHLTCRPDLQISSVSTLDLFLPGKVNIRVDATESTSYTSFFECFYTVLGILLSV